MEKSNKAILLYLTANTNKPARRNAGKPHEPSCRSKERAQSGIGKNVKNGRLVGTAVQTRSVECVGSLVFVQHRVSVLCCWVLLIAAQQQARKDHNASDAQATSPFNDDNVDRFIRTKLSYCLFEIFFKISFLFSSYFCMQKASK